MHYRYLIIGGGMSGDAAIRGIRQQDKQGSIGLISEEPFPPYNRPPLSKDLWLGKSEEMIWRPVDDLQVELHLGQRATELDVARRRVRTEDGGEFSYEKLLLATGGRVIQFPFGGEDIIYFRTLEDYRRLRKLVDSVDKFAVIGGGFIGSEIAAVLNQNGKEVVMFFPEAGIGALTFPGALSEHVTQYYRSKGVRVLAGEWVSDVRRKGGKLKVVTKSGHVETVDGVVAGIGIRPNVELAVQAGLKVNKGIVVNRYLQTTHRDIFAAGDVAEFYNPVLDRYMLVEHEEHANMTGYLAGQGMAGSLQPYEYLPYFYSEIFDLAYEAVGEISADLETVMDWEEPFQKGVIYYLRGKQLRGVLMWNLRRKVNAARRLLQTVGEIHSPEALIGKIR